MNNIIVMMYRKYTEYFLVMFTLSVSNVWFAEGKHHKHKLCMQEVGDSVIDLNDLYLPEGYTVIAGNRKFLLNICGAHPDCGGVDIAACEINSNIIPLGLTSRLSVPRKYYPNLEIKYASKKFETIIEFKCNRYLSKNIIQFIPAAKQGKKHKFVFETNFVCAFIPIHCLLHTSDDKQIDLRPLSKLNDNWLVQNSPNKTNIYLNICRKLNPMRHLKENKCLDKGAQICLVANNNTIEDLGTFSTEIQITNDEIFAYISDTPDCNHVSSKIQFLCSTTEKGPKLINFTNCGYFIKWYTPSACPHQISEYDDCKFNDVILGEVDLGLIYSQLDQARVLKDSIKLKFNICQNLNEKCNGETGRFCLIQNEREMILGKLNTRIQSKDGILTINMMGDSCPGNKNNRSVNIYFKCDYSENKTEDFHLSEDLCTLNLTIHTILACPTKNLINCDTTYNGFNYNLTDLGLLNNNYEISDPENSNLTYILNICHPVVYGPNSFCFHSLICLKNSLEPDLYQNYKILGDTLESSKLFIRDNNVLVLQYNGPFCSLNTTNPQYVTEIEFKCGNNTKQSKPKFKSKHDCIYTFSWETNYACPNRTHDSNKIKNDSIEYVFDFIHTETTTKIDVISNISKKKTDIKEIDLIKNRIIKTPPDLEDESKEVLIKTKINIIKSKDTYLSRSLYIPINTTNTNGLVIENCAVMDKSNLDLNSLPNHINISSKTGQKYTIDFCSGKLQENILNLINFELVPNAQYIQLNFNGTKRCKNGFFNSILYLQCSNNTNQPTITKEDECSVHLEWKLKQACVLFLPENKRLGLSAASLAGVIITAILLLIGICIVAIKYFWRRRKRVHDDDPILRMKIL